MLFSRTILLAGAAAGALTLSPAAHAAGGASDDPAASGQADAGPRESGRISGTVVRGSGVYVGGAEVRVEGSDVVTVTDSTGRFLIREVPAGEHQLTITYFGSETRQTAVRVVAGQTAEVRIELAEGQQNGDDIVVSARQPIAETEAAAIQYKRASTQLVDVIAADSIGRFPDQNVAAAVGRLPGVAVERSQGEERSISLRGAPNNWTTLAFDGVNVVGAGGRQARFDTVPSAIASKIVVKKAVTPDMPGETVAGNVDIVTRSPFDYPGPKIALDAGYGFNQLGGGKQMNVSGYASTRFAHDTLGILVSASHYERDMANDNFENGYEKAPEDLEPGHENRIWANKLSNKLYRKDRTSSSFSGRLEWQPSSDNRVFLSSIYTIFTDNELRNNYTFDLDQDAVKTTDTSPDSQTPRTGYADVRTGNTPLKGTLHGAEIESTLNSKAVRQRLFTNTLGGDHDAGAWHVGWRLNFTRADEVGRPSFLSSWQSPKDFTQRPTLIYDLTDPDAPKIRLFNTVRNPDGTYSTGSQERPFISPTEEAFKSATRETYLDRTDAYTARLDIDRHVSILGTDTLFQFGGEYDRRTKTSNDTVIEVLPADLKAAGIALPTQADVSIDDPYKGKMDLGYGFKYFSPDLGNQLLDSYIAAGASHIQPDNSEQNNYKVSEQIFAGYLMGTSFFDWGNIVYGARVEHVRNTGDALSQGPDGYAPTHVASDETSVFPSMHINWNINRDMKFRLSFNTGAARPEYDQLRPNFSFDDAEQIVSGGNPAARPERAKGVDAYYEWYMPSRGYLSLGAYYKDLSDILFDVELPEFGLDVLNSGSVDRSKYKFQTIANGGKGSIKGIEIAYSQPLEALVLNAGLPDWMAGFGFQANATFNDSTATAPDGHKSKLPGASDFLSNLSVYYERYGISARVNWQYRTKWLDSLGDPDIGDEYWAPSSQLSLSLRYTLNKHLQLYVDADNLTNEPGVIFAGSRDRQIQHEVYGTHYLAGVRLNF